jgi:outer membrane protein assembly factor BamB
MSGDLRVRPKTTRRLLGAAAMLVVVGVAVATYQRQASKSARAVAFAAATTTPASTTQAAARATPTAWAFHGGGALLGRAPDLGSPPMKLRWTYHADDDGDASIEGAVAIVGGSVYAADAKGVLHAIDLVSGQRRWTYQGGEEGFATTPLVCDGRVFVGDLGGMFHAVSADKGAKLWTVDTGGAIHASANAPAVSTPGVSTPAVSTADPAATRIVVSNDAGKVFCLDPIKGDVLWTAQAGDRINSAAAIVGDTAYIAGCDAKLLALNMADGTERFTAGLGAVSGGSPAVIDGRLIVGTDGGRVVCLSVPDAAPLWSYEQIKEGAMAYASPAIADGEAGGVVVIGARDRQVHAIDLAEGKPLWTFKARLDVDSSPVISGGRVYVGSKDKSLYVLDLKRGTLLWEFKASRGIVATPAIDQGVLVIGDAAGNVYCLEPATE